jgi:hypothetical protein
MSADRWIFQDGRVYKLAETHATKREAQAFAEVLSENCVVVVAQAKGGNWGVYWRPKAGNLCPYGVV